MSTVWTRHWFAPAVILVEESCDAGVLEGIFERDGPGGIESIAIAEVRSKHNLGFQLVFWLIRTLVTRCA